jgi:hypothetical protein
MLNIQFDYWMKMKSFIMFFQVNYSKDNNPLNSFDRFFRLLIDDVVLFQIVKN